MNKELRLSIICACIAGIILGVVGTIIVDHTTFKYQSLPVPLATKYFSFPEELFQAEKGDSMYLRVVGDTTTMEFYHTNLNTDQNDQHGIIILADSVFYPSCPPPLIVEELNIR